MTHLLTAIGLCGGIAGLWLLYGILQEVRTVVAKRASGWLLPTGQTLTVRLGWAIAILAGQLAPKRRCLYFPGDFFSIGNDPGMEGDPPGPGGFIFAACWAPLEWHAPGAALTDLEEDLAASRRILNPVRMTAPLLRHAAFLQIRNAGTWLLCFCRAVPIAALVLPPYVLACLIFGPPIVVAKLIQRLKLRLFV
jgi:hypothetical protein